LKMIWYLFVIPKLVLCFQIPHHPVQKSFASHSIRFNHDVTRTQQQSASALNIAAQDIIDGSSLISSISSASSSNMLLSISDFKALIKPGLIILVLGGGLIPATISANAAMGQALSGKRVDDDGNEIVAVPSTAEGPALPFSTLLLAADKVPLIEVVAIIGRISNVDSLADWKNLPSTKVPNAIDPNNPPMWLPRSTYKENIRKARFQSWPLDPKTSKPIGGEELKKEYESSLKSNKFVIGDAALDAVWDTWAGGASIATPDKVKGQLADWRSSTDSFNLNKFVGATIRGRSITGIAALTFVTIQITAFGSLFIAPFLRVILNIDVGFGQMGQCSPEGCVKLLDLF